MSRNKNENAALSACKVITTKKRHTILSQQRDRDRCVCLGKGGCSGQDEQRCAHKKKKRLVHITAVILGCFAASTDSSRTAAGLHTTLRTLQTIPLTHWRAHIFVCMCVYVMRANARCWCAWARVPALPHLNWLVRHGSSTVAK